MQRKITDLEKKLIRDGFILTIKTYGGRKSEKTLFYDYEKGKEVVRLNNTREQVEYVFLKDIHFDYLNAQSLSDLALDFCNLSDYAESIIVENNEEIKRPMNFEELDELCKEKE